MRHVLWLFLWLCMLGFFAAAGMCLLTAPRAHGQCVQAATSYGSSYATTYAATKAVVVTPTVATFVAVPVYTAIYVPPPYSPPAPPAPAPAVAAKASPSQEAQMLKILQSLDARLKSLESRASLPAVGTVASVPSAPAPAPAVQPAVQPVVGGAAPVNAVAVLQAKCASCHESKVAADKGGAFTLFDGATLAKLTDKQVNKVIALTYKGTMPPKKANNPLGDAEMSAVVEFFSK